MFYPSTKTAVSQNYHRPILGSVHGDFSASTDPYTVDTIYLLHGDEQSSKRLTMAEKRPSLGFDRTPTIEFIFPSLKHKRHAA
jgi:hypothetical protein